MAVATLWLVVFGVLHATTGVMVFSLFSLAPLIVATAADARRTAVFAGAAVALTVWAERWHGPAADVDLLDPGRSGLRYQRDGGRGGGYTPPT